MALITKPPAWAYCSHNLASTPSGTPGTSYTSGASNTDAAAASLITALTHDVEYLVIIGSSFGVSTANTSTLLDILIDPAGGTSFTSTLIPDLLAGESIVTNGAIPPQSFQYNFPIWIKAGASIGLQARTAHTAGVAGRIVVFAYGGNANPTSWWCGQSVEAIGINAASSQGTNHTPGNSGAYSTWTNFGSTLSNYTGAIQFGVQGTNTDTTQASGAYHIEFGVSSSRIGHPIVRSTNTTEQGFMLNVAPVFCNLAAGTQLQVRGTASGTAEALDVAAYAVS